MAFTIPRRLQKRVLLTRPYSDSLKLAECLSQQGIESVISPVLEISYPSFEEGALESLKKKTPDLVILTSRHAVGLLTQFDFKPDITLYVVGPSTEKACRAGGFSHIITADQSATSLFDLLKKETLKNKNILYLRGETIALDLKAILAEEGAFVQEVVAYTAKPAVKLTDDAILALRQGTLTDVVFYSLRSAQIFMDLIKKEELESKLLSLSAHAISSQILDFLKSFDWQKRLLFQCSIN